MRGVHRVRADPDRQHGAVLLERTCGSEAASGGRAGAGVNHTGITVSYGTPLLHLRFLCCILEFIETTMSSADPNQALSRGNAVSTELIPVLGLVLIIGVGVAGPA